MKNRRLYYSISFVEGAAVMATEIIGAKFLAPLFGSSLYVWSAVMAMTLGGLAGGYFYGGRMSQKENIARRLHVTLFFAGVFILIMPLIIHVLSPVSLNLPLLLGVVISSCCILIPPVFCMGMVSPLIVQLISGKSDESGKRAGEVYAVSTVGGILATFLTGFYLIPVFGLTWPLFFFGGLLLLLSLSYFIRQKEKTFLTITFFIVAASVLNVFKESSSGEETILYKSEGILGKLEVMETNWEQASVQENDKHRFLLVNNIIQTWVERDSNRSWLPYINQIDHLSLSLKKKQNALILGLGGGAVANVLTKKKFAVTAVELDVRVIEVAHEYFNVSKDVRIINDDARHAINGLQGSYDLIVVDLFSGEVTPSHVLSEESIHQMERLLDQDGLIVFNTYGYIQPPAGLGNLSLLKTLKTCGLNYRIGRNGNIEQEDFRNFLIVASRREVPQVEHELMEPIDLHKGTLITDNHPVLEFQNALAAKRWRYHYIQNFIKRRKNI